MSYKSVQVRIRFCDGDIPKLLLKLHPFMRGVVVKKALAYCVSDPASEAYGYVFENTEVFRPVSVPVRAFAPASPPPKNFGKLGAGTQRPVPGACPTRDRSVEDRGGGASEADPEEMDEYEVFLKHAENLNKKEIQA